jgi:hypothetical protein
MIKQIGLSSVFNISKELQNFNDFQDLTTHLLQNKSEQSVVRGITTILSSLWDKFIWVIALRSEGSEDSFRVYGLYPDEYAADDFLKFLKGITFSPEKDSKTVYGSDIPAALHHLQLQALHMFPIQTADKNLGILLLGTYDTAHLPIEHAILSGHEHWYYYPRHFNSGTQQKAQSPAEETLKTRTEQHNRRIEEQRAAQPNERHRLISTARLYSLNRGCNRRLFVRLRQCFARPDDKSSSLYGRSPEWKTPLLSQCHSRMREPSRPGC